jgi:mono/diheme cytochrome c family protein
MEITPKRPFLFGLIIGILAAVFVGGVLSFLLFPFALKHHSVWPLEDAIGTNRVLAAIPPRYKALTNPVFPTTGNLNSAESLYLSNCNLCHGSDGMGDAPIGKNLFPPAADLTAKKTKNKTDGELYWIVENGLSFVGMPAFKPILKEMKLWEIVLHIRALQKTVVETGSPVLGKKIYTEKGCGACHGAEADGDMGPKLTGTARSVADVTTKIRSGGAVMPKYDDKTVSDGDITEIYKWLKREN